MAPASFVPQAFRVPARFRSATRFRGRGHTLSQGKNVRVDEKRTQPVGTSGLREAPW